MYLVFEVLWFSIFKKEKKAAIEEKVLKNIEEGLEVCFGVNILYIQSFCYDVIFTFSRSLLDSKVSKTQK